MSDKLIAFVFGAGLVSVAWRFVWTEIWKPRVRRLEVDAERLRERNVEATAECLETETKLEAIGTQLADARAARDRDRQCLEAEILGERIGRGEATKRAEVAEGIVRGQAKHVEALQRSNDTMLQAITDMRRVGFSLPSDLLNAPDPEVITTVHDDDLQAVKDYPHLAAGDSD